MLTDVPEITAAPICLERHPVHTPPHTYSPPYKAPESQQKHSHLHSPPGGKPLACQ